MRDNFPILNLQGTLALKAVAILGVVGIHILSSLKSSPFVTTAQFQVWAVGFDQLARISVPLFVAISGYGLAQSYSHKTVRLLDFYKRRVGKILPLYLIWSFIFMFLFSFVPAWKSVVQLPHFGWQLLLGSADYHLYFVPMILQLYLLFPILFSCFKRWPAATLAVGISIQLLWWWFFSYQGLSPVSWKYFIGDAEQYIWMTNWIAYFILGMYLPTIWKLFVQKKWLVPVACIAVLLNYCYTTINALDAIQNGVDPLLALKFTRYPIFIYAMIAIPVLSYLVSKLKKVPSFFVILGNHSYGLYLSHTLFLRILFGFYLFV